MTNLPLISILMTAYNREKYIIEAIKSVLASTYHNWELIIVDDGSKDKTVEIAQSFEAKDHRIKVFINEKNLGDYPNRNQAASYAKGKYIKYLDSDDIIYLHGLEVMVNAMEQFPEAGIGLTFNNHGECHLLPIEMKSVDVYKYHFFNKGLLYIGPSGCIYNRDYFYTIGQFQNFKVASDYEFNLRAAIYKPIVLFQRDLFWWRQHEGQEIVNSSRNNEYVIQNYIINKKNLKISPLDERIKKKALKNNEILMGRRLILLILKFKSIRIILNQTKFPVKYFIRCLYFANKI